MNKLLIVSGPTATGKTLLALHLAKKFNGELVSADSRQVYKDLDALTGKDRSDEIPIHLYDVIEPDKEFSVAHFVRLATKVIHDIWKRGKLPIVVGGTGFYLRALIKPIKTISIPPNKKLRGELEKLSVDGLQNKLINIDAKKWNKMHQSDRKNPRRLTRAIEIALSKSIDAPEPILADKLWIGLTTPLPIIKKRIENRIRIRFETALKETKVNLPPILGVKQLTDFKKGILTKEEAILSWIMDEFDYVKRQMTWFKKEKEINWFDISQTGFEQKVEALVQEWYTPN